MASICPESVELKQPTGDVQACTAIDELSKEAKECLVEKSLCTLMSMCQNKPKFKSTLENTLGPCTVVAPYMSPLDALAAANASSDLPAVPVDVPHAKTRVYTVLERVKAASDERMALKKIEGRKYDLAPRGSDIEKGIVDEAIGWLQGEPEGTEESLVDGLVRRCEKKADCSRLVFEKLQKAGRVTLEEGRLLYALPPATEKSGQNSEPFQPSNARTRVLRLLHECPPEDKPSTVAEFLEFVQPVCNVWFTVPPARFFGMNMKHIKHRRVQDHGNEKEALKQTLTAKKPHERKNSKRKLNSAGSESKSKSESESESNPRVKTKFGIGVQPGEHVVRERISLTPDGLTGVEVSVTGQTTPPPKKHKTDSAKRPDNPERMRIVGQSKSLSGFFKGRLTVAVRGRNAVLVRANDQERNDIISKVTEWVSSIQKCSSSTDQLVASKPPQQTVPVPRLQQDLANLCVGKVRRLTPATITDLLQNSGYISIDDDRKVSYYLPTDREVKTTSWQQRTVEMAVKSCRFSKFINQACHRKQGKGKDGSKNKPKAKGKSNKASTTVLKVNAGADRECSNDEYSDDDDYEAGDFDYDDGDNGDDDHYLTMQDLNDTYDNSEDYDGGDPDYDELW